MNLTKTRSASRNWSREADQLDFNNTRLSQSLVSSRQSIGAASTDQSIKGKYTPNVQSALEDMASMFPVKVNQVIMMMDGYSPEGVSMIERLVIDGTAGVEPVSVYGIPVKVESGDNKSTITTKIYDALQILQSEDKFFKSISRVSGVDDQLDVEFLDTRPHDNFDYAEGTITINGSTIQDAVPGYGVWARIGSFELDDGAGGKNKIHYFQRTS